jgi:hypothetical protein
MPLLTRRDIHAYTHTHTYACTHQNDGLTRGRLSVLPCVGRFHPQQPAAGGGRRVSTAAPGGFAAGGDHASPATIRRPNPAARTGGSTGSAPKSKKIQSGSSSGNMRKLPPASSSAAGAHSMGPPKLPHEVRKKCEKMLQDLVKRQECQWFLRAVNEQQDGATDYYKIITKPMDLGEVSSRAIH